VTSARDVEGEWIDPQFESGLVQHCREAWHVPFDELSDAMLATFLRQEIATEHVISEAQRRLERGSCDGSELYDGELRASLAEASARHPRRGT